MISLAFESCKRKRLREIVDSEKKTPWWNQDVKEAIRVKKDAFKALLQNKSSSNLQFRYYRARKVAALVLKMSKEHFWKEDGHCWDSN